MLSARYILLSLLLAVATFATNEDYKEAQILQIQRTEDSQRIVNSAHLQILGGNATCMDVLVPGLKLNAFKKTLEYCKTFFKTVITDVLREINLTSVIGTENRLMNWDEYQTLEAINEYMDTLARQNPHFVSVFVIGRSFEGRPIRVIKISSGRPNAKSVLVDGGIHAREWVSQSSATYIIHQLIENRFNLPNELLDLDFYVIPVVNPDGYEFCRTDDRMWRKNRSRRQDSRCVGVDLNRNFNYKFGGRGTSDFPCDDNYNGEEAASEPETKCFKRFVRTIQKNLKGYVSFHSYGNMILLPFGTRRGAVSSDYDELMKVADSARKAIKKLTGSEYICGNVADIIYPAAGGSIDWMKGKMGAKYTYSVELGDGARGFMRPCSDILPIAKEAWEIVKAVAMASARA